MLNFISDALTSFQGIFSRNSSWILFCMLIFGFIGATEMIGVTSFCRFWGGEKALYMAFLNFFRADSWSLPALLTQWETFVMNQDVGIKVQDRTVLIGDHTYAPKDGRRMPGVVSLRQDSETQTKPSYFRGHCWGAIGMAVGSMASPFCLPLAFGIHQGMIHIGQEHTAESKTMGTRIVQMAIDFASRHDVLSILVLDAFFPTGAVFKLACSIYSISMKQPLITLIIKAKKTVQDTLIQNSLRTKNRAVQEYMEKRSNLWKCLIISTSLNRSHAVYTVKQRKFSLHPLTCYGNH